MGNGLMSNDQIFLKLQPPQQPLLPLQRPRNQLQLLQVSLHLKFNKMPPELFRSRFLRLGNIN